MNNGSKIQFKTIISQSKKQIKEKVECRPDKIVAVRYPEKVGCRPDRIAAVRHPDNVERWPDRIPDVRCPGGMSENFRPGGMSDATCHKGGRLRGQGRGSHAAIFREDPTLMP